MSSRLALYWGSGLVAMVMGCGHPQLVGSSMLNMQPQPPTFAGQLDFDLLERVRGKACIAYRSGLRGPSIEYWIGRPAMLDVAADVRPAVAAAALDALDRSADADTLLVTRIITEAKGDEEICAYVYARAVKLEKAEPPPEPAQARPSEPSRDLDEGSEDEDPAEDPPTRDREQPIDL